VVIILGLGLSVTTATTLLSRGNPISAQISQTTSSTTGQLNGASGLRLAISHALAGGLAEVRVIVDHAEDVRGFNLLLQFGPNRLMEGAEADSQRNSALSPACTIGSYALNGARDGPWSDSSDRLGTDFNEWHHANRPPAAPRRRHRTAGNNPDDQADRRGQGH